MQFSLFYLRVPLHGALLQTRIVKYIRSSTHIINNTIVEIVGSFGCVEVSQNVHWKPILIHSM